MVDKVTIREASALRTVADKVNMLSKLGGVAKILEDAAGRGEYASTFNTSEFPKELNVKDFFVPLGYFVTEHRDGQWQPVNRITISWLDIKEAMKCKCAK